MIACHAAGIRVFATGGIGGVHRGAIDGPNPSFDISADLDELARTPVAVVCAGPKAILDVPRTLEYLETRGVPVVSIGIDEVPGFYARGSGIKAPTSVPDVAAAAAVIRAHEAMGLTSGLVICAPVPEDRALPDAVTREAVDQAIREADNTGVGGAALTPWLLARVAAITDGASVKANIALIVNNAKVGGELAGALVALADGRVRSRTRRRRPGDRAGVRTTGEERGVTRRRPPGVPRSRSRRRRSPGRSPRRSAAGRAGCGRRRRAVGRGSRARACPR